MEDYDLPFDPTLDDCPESRDWREAPLVQVVPGVYDGFRITSWKLTEASICGQLYHFSPALDVRGYVTQDGTLWMSDVPQERAMMYENARHSRGHILIGGLGLGLYPQYAAEKASHLTIIESNAPLVDVVLPTVEITTRPFGIPTDVKITQVETFLRAEPTTRYDTIFLDTWHELDPMLLPHINALRDQAVRHLAPQGRVLLWGYAWMVRLFVLACEQILEAPPDERQAILDNAERPEVKPLLQPVVDHFARHPIEKMRYALAWCRQYIVGVTV